VFVGKLIYKKIQVIARRRAIWAFCVATFVVASNGCQLASNSGGPASVSVALRGEVRGGVQPISGSTIELYAAGEAGPGSAAQSLLAEPVRSDSNGAFSIAGDFTCPSASSEVYLAAQGGKPTLSSGTENPAIALIAMLGPCDTLGAQTNITINEVTTVGSIWPVSRYATALSGIGASPFDSSFASAAVRVSQLVNVALGVSPGTVTPAGYVPDSSKIYSLANILDTCINSSGGTIGDGTPCGNLFSASASTGEKAPTDTFEAARRIALSPEANVQQIFNLTGPTRPFQPALAAAPADWSIDLLAVPLPPTISPASGTYVKGQPISVSTTTPGAIIRYTLDGSIPSSSSPVYSGPLVLTTGMTVRASVEAGGTRTAPAAETFAITPARLAFSRQPSSGYSNSVLSPAPSVEVLDSAGKPITSTAYPITVNIASNPGGAALNGTKVITTVGGVATFAALSLSAAASGYTLSATSPGLTGVTSTSFNESAPTITMKLPDAYVPVHTALTGSIALAGVAASSVRVALSTDTPTHVSVSPTVLTIPAGQSTASFTYTGVGLGGATLSAAASGYRSGSEHVGASAQLVFSKQPPGGRAGSVMTSAPAVEVVDGKGSPLTSGTYPVTLKLAANPAGAVLTGTTSATSVGAVATFASLGVSKAGSGYTLSASSPGLTSVTSSPFNITVAAVPAIALTLPSPSIAVGNTLTGKIALGAASSTATTVRFASSAPTAASVTPTTITIPAGQTTASFVYNGLATGVSTLTAAGTGYNAGSAQVTVTSQAIPASLFGLSVLNFSLITPSIPYGTARSWDEYPTLDWSDINTSAGVYNFTYLDKFIAINQASGADMIYTLGRTPHWASSQPNTAGGYGPGQCAPPANMTNYDNYLKAIATHAAGRIKYWEIWNEPNDPTSYCGSIASMVTMAQHAAQIIKSIDPTALILSPSATGTPGASWLSSFLSAGGSGYIDIVAFHGYSSAHAEDIVSMVSAYKAVMAAHGLSSKPLWDTESSWAGSGNLGTPASALQVGFVAKDYLLHWSLGVSRFVWYAYDGGSIWGGLLTALNVISPAATSYRQAYLWMVGATMTTPCAENSSGVWTCTLSRAGGYQAEAVWISNKTASFTIPAQYTKYQDLAGVVHNVTSRTITVGDQPILLETTTIP
jgi:hypothetical protein